LQACIRKRSFEAPCLQAGVPELSATDAWTEIAVGDVPQYDLFLFGTVQNGSLSRRFVVIPFRRRAASRAVIAKLIEFGYLRLANRYNDGVIEHAVERLGRALRRDGVICDVDLSRHLLSLTPNPLR
jgi:hypothetical protein